MQLLLGCCLFAWLCLASAQVFPYPPQINPDTCVEDIGPVEFEESWQLLNAKSCPPLNFEHCVFIHEAREKCMCACARRAEGIDVGGVGTFPPPPARPDGDGDGDGDGGDGYGDGDGDGYGDGDGDGYGDGDGNYPDGDGNYPDGDGNYPDGDGDPYYYDGEYYDYYEEEGEEGENAGEGGGGAGKGGGYTGDWGDEDLAGDSSSSSSSEEDSDEGKKSKKRKDDDDDDSGAQSDDGGGSGAFCFHAEGTVTTRLYGRVSLEQLAALPSGTEVLAWDGAGDNRLHYSPVRYWMHADGAARASFKRVRTESGERLLLTDEHLIYRSAGCGQAQPTAVFARDVAAGDCVLVQAEAEEEGRARLTRVVSVDVEEAAGVFAPVTESGTLLVDGVVASCFASNTWQTLHGFVFGYVRALLGLVERLATDDAFAALHQAPDLFFAVNKLQRYFLA